MVNRRVFLLRVPCPFCGSEPHKICKKDDLDGHVSIKHLDIRLKAVTSGENYCQCARCKAQDLREEKERCPECGRLRHPPRCGCKNAKRNKIQIEVKVDGEET